MESLNSDQANVYGVGGKDIENWYPEKGVDILVQSKAMTVGFILRLIPQLQSEHATIIEAQKSRATEFDKGGLFTRFRKHSTYIIPLVLRSLKIVSDLSIAMEARAFDPYTKRTFARHLEYSTVDKVILIVMAIILVGAIGLRIAGFGNIEGIVGFGQ